MQTTITVQPGNSVIVIGANAPLPDTPAPAAPPAPAQPPAPPLAVGFDLSLQIADLSAYLVQRRMPDGSPGLVPGTGFPQLASDTMTWRKRDYRADGSPGGYCASDGVSD